MFHKIEALGPMVALDLRPITSEDLRGLDLQIDRGRKAGDLRSTALPIETTVGFELEEFSPRMSLRLNGRPLTYERSMVEDFEFTYLKLSGSIRPLDGPEQFYLVLERRLSLGRAELVFGGRFQPMELRFEVERFGMFDGSVKSILSPTYKGQYLQAAWTAPYKSICYVVSSKRGRLNLPI